MSDLNASAHEAVNGVLANSDLRLFDIMYNDAQELFKTSSVWRGDYDATHKAYVATISAKENAKAIIDGDRTDTQVNATIDAFVAASTALDNARAAAAQVSPAAAEATVLFRAAADRADAAIAAFGAGAVDLDYARAAVTEVSTMADATP